MKSSVLDLQDPSNPANGRTIKSDAELDALLEASRERPPFLCELTGDNGYKLLVGLGGDQGCLQYSPSDGRPPYLMAVGDTFAEDGTFIEFLTANTPTPIPAKHCMPIALVRE